jgi:branched-subunit amino acid ABC-type transport system permease component
VSASVIALEFNTNLLGPALVLGVAAAGLYGLLAVSLVLTYRVSRTIGFIHGGIAIFTAHLYWWLVYDSGVTGAFAPNASDVRMNKLAGLVVVVAVGTLIGLFYGLTVTGKRMGNWPRLNLTVYSLAWLLGLIAVTSTLIEPASTRIPSIFGTNTYKIFGGVISIHQVATLLILVGVIALLGFVLLRTQTGINIRAVADDVEASRFVGVPLTKVGAGVYAFAGGLSGFAGALVTATVGMLVPELLTVFLRALTVSVLGGLTSFSLALVGCVLLGVGEALLTAGVFGQMSIGRQEVVIMAALFGLVLFINRLRPIKVLEVESL